MAPTSPPPLHFLVTSIKLALCNLLSSFWPLPDATSPVGQKSMGLPTSAQLTSVTRMSYRMLRYQTSWSDHPALDCLPVYFNDCQIEMKCYQLQKEKGTLNLGKMVIGLTFQAVLGMTLAATPGQPKHQPHFLALCIVGGAMVIAFSACLSGIFLRHRKAASILETIGSAFAALGFFLMKVAVMVRFSRMLDSKQSFFS